MYSTLTLHAHSKRGEINSTVAWLSVMVKRSQTVVKERTILNDIHLFFFFFFGGPPGPNRNLICPRNIKLNWNGLIARFARVKEEAWQSFGRGCGLSCRVPRK